MTQYVPYSPDHPQQPPSGAESVEAAPQSSPGAGYALARAAWARAAAKKWEAELERMGEQYDAYVAKALAKQKAGATDAEIQRAWDTATAANEKIGEALAALTYFEDYVLALAEGAAPETWPDPGAPGPVLPLPPYDPDIDPFWSKPDDPEFQPDPDDPHPGLQWD